MNVTLTRDNGNSTLSITYTAETVAFEKFISGWAHYIYDDEMGLSDELTNQDKLDIIGTRIKEVALSEEHSYRSGKAQDIARESEVISDIMSV